MSRVGDMIAAEFAKRNVIILDCETTGLDPNTDEILQLSIIDGNGTQLYNSYFRPTVNTSWDEACSINGILPSMVADAPAISEELPKIQRILSACDLIVGYNPSFDLRFLTAAGCDYSHLWDNAFCRYWVEDLMELFAAIYGDWNPYFGSYTWQKLSVAAAYYGYDWGNSSAHDAMADCKATLHIWNCMREHSHIETAYRTLCNINQDNP